MNADCAGGNSRKPVLFLDSLTGFAGSNVSPDFPVSRDRIIEVLHAEKILARRYFWPGCHNMEPYRSYYPHAGLVLPNTDRVAEQVMVLPSGSAVQPETIHAITSVLRVLGSAV